jgi:nitrite reductase/ring-hydroxylating ferredoxin subunit
MNCYEQKSKLFKFAFLFPYCSPTIYDMNTRRSVVLGVAIALLSTIFPSAIAATGPTLKPTKLGQIIVWRGKKYTSIKQGKKLIWDKGVLIPAKVSPSPTATASPSPSPSPSKSPLVMKDIALGSAASIAIGETKIMSKGKSYVITRTSSGLIAFDTTCTHNGCAIDFRGKALVCPCHGAEFDPLTGSPTAGPALLNLKSYEVKEVDGQVVVVDYPW